MDYFCMAPRCSLCRFDFVKNEDVLILKPDGSPVALPFSKFENDVCTYEPCYAGCQHWDQQLLGYHPSCVQHDYYQSIPKLLNATAYTHDPWPGENMRRLSWIRVDLACTIYRSLALRQLPYEVCEIIAQYCFREYAVYLSSKFCQDNLAANFCVELSKPVWAYYASLDGLAYIVSLTNKPTRSDAVLLLQPDVAVQTVYVAEDHLGIREVYFAYSNKARDPPAPGLWWRTVRVHGTKLRGQTDGSKLRRLFCPITSHTPHNSVLWATLQPYPEQLRLTMLIKLSGGPLKMTSLRLDEKVTGYSFCWDNYIIALKAHSYDREEDLSYYKHIMSSHPYALWLHIPLRSRERITEIWQRRRKHGREVALIAVTNREGIYVMGAYPKSCWHPCSYELLYKAEPGGGSFFVDESPAGIQAVASGPLDGSTAACRLPTALSPYPESMPFEDYLYTIASVEDVSHVRLCRAQSDSIITGLAFEYTDGHQECVGQTRLDCLDDVPTRIDVSRKMWLKISRSPHGFPQVVDMGFSRARKSGDEYFYITWHGTLEWWFSLNQCRLYHNGQASLSTRL